MKDLMGVELQDGDLVADIRTNYAWVVVGILSGGQTRTGKIRILTMYSHKHKSLTLEKHLLKITPQQALDFLHRKYEGDNPISIQSFIKEVINPKLNN